MRVDASDIGTVQGVQYPVPDVVEGEEVAVDRTRVVCRRIDHQLSGPEVEAGDVDLERGSVTELQVEAPLTGVDRRLAGLRRVAGPDRLRERLESTAHP